MEVVPAPVHIGAEIVRTIENLSGRPNGGLILPTDTFTDVNLDLIVELIGRHRVPTIAASPGFARKGGLMSYTVDYEPQFRQAAFYVDRFFKGTKLAELPVQTPTKFILTVNLKSAAALRIEVP